jgi:hypothetical protein
MTKKIKFCRFFSILCARKSQHDFDSSYLMGTRHSFFMCHMLPKVMYESWIENIEQVICHILSRGKTDEILLVM